MMATTAAGYYGTSVQLSQTLGRISACLVRPDFTLPTYLHYLSEIQEWTDTLPETLKITTTSTQMQIRAANFLALRRLDAIIIATRPFLGGLVQYGEADIPEKYHKCFKYLANIASLAARESLALLRRLGVEGQVKGLTAFDKHFLVQDATVLALSSVILRGKRDERVRFRECIEMILRLPGGRFGYLIRDMRGVEMTLERFAKENAPVGPYLLPSGVDSLILSDSVNIWDTPGYTLDLRNLQRECEDVIAEQQMTGDTGGKRDHLNDNLSKFISKRVIWEDVGEYLSIGLKRAGFTG